MSYKKKRNQSEASEDIDDPAPIQLEDDISENQSSPEHLPDINHFGTKADYYSPNENYYNASDTRKRPSERLSIDSDNSYQYGYTPKKRRATTSSFSDTNDNNADVNDQSQSEDDSVSRRGSKDSRRDSQDSRPVINHYGAQNYTPNENSFDFDEGFDHPKRRETSSFSEDNGGEYGEIGDASDKSPEPAGDSGNERGSNFYEAPQESEFEAPTYKVPKSLSVNTKRVSQLSTSTSSDTDQDDGETGLYMRPNSMPMRMMERMGYTKGTGLGKHSQGIKEPIAESKQIGKRGLGFEIPDLKQHNLKFDPSMENISVEEHVYWLGGPNQLPPDYESIQNWLVVGDVKQTIDDETNFCKPTVLTNILNSKSVFDKLDGKELMKTRSRANPFESIKGVLFINRAAMKMANLDAVCNFMFTEPRDKKGTKLLKNSDLLYFADVCAGPGGFTEYVLYRKKWRAKGIGFTLKGPNDFKLEDFYAAAPETFEPYYGVKDDGNVYNPKNIDSLHNHVMNVTHGIGVHFMMADGGFSVEGQENIQEILSKRLYLCQCLVALRIVRVGGHFVVKLFDIFTPFSVGLVYLMYLCFDFISIHKPNTSRPANSERYLICKFKKHNCDGVIQYMTEINIKLDKLPNQNKDVCEIVPLDILKNTLCPFYQYVYNSNNSIGDHQIIHLLKIAHYAELPNYLDESQRDIRAQCLRLYQIPDMTRQRPETTDVGTVVRNLMGNKPIGNIRIEKVTHVVLPKICKYNYSICILASREDDDVSQPTLFAGLGGPNVYRYIRNERWERMSGNVTVYLPNKTIVLGELIQEYVGERLSQTFQYYLHIIDAAYLAGEDIRHHDTKERLKFCKAFTEAISHSGNYVRSKKMHNLMGMEMCLNKLQQKISKKFHKMRADVIDNESNRFTSAGGLLLLPLVKEPFTIGFSNNRKLEYYQDTRNDKHSFWVDQRPKESWANFDCSKLKVWWWNAGVQMQCDDHLQPSPDEVQPEEFLHHLKTSINTLQFVGSQARHPEKTTTYNTLLGCSSDSWAGSLRIGGRDEQGKSPYLLDQLERDNGKPLPDMKILAKYRKEWTEC